ncbi:MAG: glycosyltransferase family protein [Salibacteraceae bacterium]
MRVLYGIQGTGNGHISRALEILPELKKRAHVDILVSGRQSELNLPYPIKYQLHGLGFVFGARGGIDLIETYKKSRLRKFYKEVKNLDLSSYDLIISDFEPITAWASIQKGKYCVGLSNQAALLSPLVPKGSQDDVVGKFIIKNYAPCAQNIGFSYKAYDHYVYSPIIRKSIRALKCENNGEYVVYLPSYSDDRIVNVLGQLPDIPWHVFSKRATSSKQFGNVRISKLNGASFELALTTAPGVLTAAGFGTTTEALFLNKKLLVIPQKHQYEQGCNAMALSDMGVPIVKSLKPKHLEKIEEWAATSTPIHLDYPDLTERIIDRIFQEYPETGDPYVHYITEAQYGLQPV